MRKCQMVEKLDTYDIQDIQCIDNLGCGTGGSGVEPQRSALTLLF